MRKSAQFLALPLTFIGIMFFAATNVPTSLSFFIFATAFYFILSAEQKRFTLFVLASFISGAPNAYLQASVKSLHHYSRTIGQCNRNMQ